MHAYLIISHSKNNQNSAIDSLAKKLHSKIMEYPIPKIEDVRNLNNLIRLSFEEPTLIVSPNVNEATEEALNAFLKNLEEPQDNIYFALTSPSTKKVLPTIVSRCEIVLVKGAEEPENAPEIEEFLNLPEGKKLSFIEKIKDREKALELAENSVNFIHSLLHENDVKYTLVAANLEEACKTYSRLKANGNVNLQLVNFVINYKNG